MQRIPLFGCHMCEASKVVGAKVFLWSSDNIRRGLQGRHVHCTSCCGGLDGEVVQAGLPQPPVNPTLNIRRSEASHRVLPFRLLIVCRKCIYLKPKLQKMFAEEFPQCDLSTPHFHGLFPVAHFILRAICENRV